MSINVGLNAIGNLMNGSSQVDKLYLGSNLVWQRVTSAYKYVRVTYHDTSTLNPYEVNVLAGTTQTQLGSTITASHAPLYGTLGALIDGSTTVGAYWDTTAGTPPWIVNLTLAQAHTDLTSIELWFAYAHVQATVEISTDNVTWKTCSFNHNTGNTQVFNIPA